MHTGLVLKKHKYKLYFVFGIKGSFFFISFTQTYTNQESNFLNQENYLPLKYVPGGYALNDILCATYFKNVVVEGWEVFLDLLPLLPSNLAPLIRSIMPNFKTGKLVTRHEWLNTSIKL